MKKFFTFFSLLILFQSVFSQGFNGDTWADAVNSKSADLILTNVQSQKFADSKTQTGICFDIMEDFVEYVRAEYGVAVSLDYRPVADPSNFQSFLTAVENSKGGVIGLGDITITEERKQTYDFSPPFFDNVAILITKKSVAELPSMDKIPTAFEGMKAVSQGGTTHDLRIQDLAKRYGDFPIIYAASAADKTILVRTSPKYFTYVDLPNYLDLYAKGMGIRRHAVGDVYGESYGLILPKGSDWTPIISQFFNANGGYMKSQEYQQILINNLGPEVVELLESL